MRKSYDVTQAEAARKKRTRTSALLIFLCIPITIFAGIVLMQNQNYMLVSTLVLILTMLPFFMVFEKRKPKAREIVLIAMMAAITTAVQMVFHVSIPIQAGTAMIVISGIALGPEAGFLIGALARFVLNFYMGQGPWTPWQMFCYGLMGFLAGLVFSKVELEGARSRSFKVIMGPIMCVAAAVVAAYLLFLFFPGEDGTFMGWRLYAFGLIGLIVGVLVQHKRMPADNITITVFTFFVTFIIYGGLMNICAMITSSGAAGAGEISLDTMKVLYISGAPYDLLHAGTAALFTFLFGNSIIKKLERIKIKYGIYR